MKLAKTLAAAALCLSVCSSAFAAAAVKGYDIDETCVKISVPQIKGAAGGKFVDENINKALNYQALKQLYAAFPEADRNEEAMRTSFEKAFAGKDGSKKARDFIGDVASFANFKLSADVEEVKALGSSVTSFELHSAFTVHFNGDNFLSVEQRGYIYTGGAHGNTIYDAATFDLTTGREVYLFNLFKPGSNYMKRINEIVDRLEAQEREKFFADVVVNDSDRFYFDSNGSLVITYAPYEVAPYAVGIVNFTIPQAEIADILAVEIK